jgi:glycogen operon protein
LGKSENWYSIVDTSLPLNQIACNLEEATLVETENYLVEARSCVVLMSKSNHRQQSKPIH